MYNVFLSAISGISSFLVSSDDEILMYIIELFIFFVINIGIYFARAIIFFERTYSLPEKCPSVTKIHSKVNHENH